MATLNPFDLLVDDDNDDPSQLIAKLPPPPSKAAAGQAPPEKSAAAAAAKMPTKPLPPSQAVREAKTEFQRGERGGGRVRGGGRGRYFNQDSADKENSYANNNGFSGGYRPPRDGEVGRRGGYGGPRGGFQGGRRDGFSNGEAENEERPRRAYDRRSGTGRGNEFKREGAGRGNWGTPTDEIAPATQEFANDTEKKPIVEGKQTEQEGEGDASKDPPTNEPEEKEPEDKEMTLEEYEKVLEEKRKALMALKPEVRKVDLDKEFASMQLISNKKNDDDVFIKLGSEKDKKKEAVEKVKKTKSINEFLKPAEGESYNRYGGRGRGRGRGRGGNNANQSLSIADVGQFPSLGSK